MIVEWLAYALAVSLVVSVAAWLAEQGAREKQWPTRWVWVAAMAVSIGLPLAAWLAPAAAPPAPSVVAAPTALVLESIPTLAPRVAASTALTPTALALLAWGGLSFLLLAGIGGLAVRLHQRRRGWGRRTIDGVDVWVSRRTGPAAVGLIRGHVVVPEWALGLDAARRRLLVLHEAEHVRARDPQLMVASLVVCALVPWNLPLWWQLRRLRLAVEVDCDERVIRRAGDARGYGSLLLEVSQRRAHLALALAEPRSMLERRIRMITKTTKGAATLRALGLAAVAGMVLAVACETPGPTGPADAGSEPLALAEVRSELAGECEPTWFINGARSSIGVVEALETSEVETIHVYRGEYMERIPVPAGAQPPCAIVSILTKTGTPDEQAAFNRLHEEMAAARRREGADAEGAPVLTLAEVMDEPTFTPMTVRPQLRNGAEVRDAMERYYPPLLRNAGIGGTVNVWHLLDAQGQVRRALINETSGYPALDQAALRVAEEMEFTPAYNRDQAVPVWVALDVTFEQPESAPEEPAEEMEVLQTTRDDDGTPAATPMTQAPRLTNADEYRAAIERIYPESLKSQGVGGTVNMWVYIDREGRVERTMINGSSGHPELDRAALMLMDVPRFTPAKNGDDVTAVWVALDVRFEAP